MPQQRLYFEYVDNELIPYWYVLTFKSYEINWDKPVLYFEVIKPFEFINRDDFDESIPGMSIYLSDLVFNNTSDKKIGIRLTPVKKRIEQFNYDPAMIRQFILSAPEVNDLINFLPKKLKFNMLVNWNQFTK